MHGGKCTGALRPARTTSPAASALARVTVGGLTCVLLLGGCAAGAPSVDYLDSPTRVQPPHSTAAGRGYDDPVYPSDAEPTSVGGDVCGLLPIGEVEDVSGLAGLAAVPASQVLCSYQSAGRAVFRLTLHSYPESTEPETVLQATVGPYGEIEAAPGVGDAAAYVPDTGADLPPSLFVAEDVDEGVAVLTLAFDEDYADPKNALIELGERAAEEL